MNPSVFNNIELTSKEVYKKYTDSLSNMGDKISNTHKYGVANKLNKLEFIRIKNLLPFVKTADNLNFNNCINNYKAEVLNRFKGVLS